HERAVDATLVQLAAEALRAVAAVAQARGEVGVRIGSVVEGTLGAETRHYLVRHLVWYPAPVQLLLDLVGRARAGSQILQGRSLGCQEPLGRCDVCLLLNAQRAPHPQVPRPHESLGDPEGKTSVQENRHPGRLVLLHSQACNGSSSRSPGIAHHSSALLSLYYCTYVQYSRSAEGLSRTSDSKSLLRTAPRTVFDHQEHGSV